MQPEHSHSRNMKLSRCTQAFVIAVVVLFCFVVVGDGGGGGGGIFYCSLVNLLCSIYSKEQSFFRKRVK